jgi:hypothetical protein
MIHFGAELSSGRDLMPIGARAALAALAFAFAASSAASADPATRSWRKLTQVEDKYATYVNLPGDPKAGAQYTVRLVVLYRPGTAAVGGKEVAYDEYPGLTVDCTMQKARRGVRLRHGADGTVVAKEDDETFRLFDGGSNEDDVAKARCDNTFTGKAFQVNDGPKWMAAARANMADVVRRAPH